MIKVYFNYPTSRVTVHGDPSCPHIRKQSKPSPRIIVLDPTTFSAEIIQFINKQHKFASAPTSNDMWLDINFDDQQFEVAVAQYVLELLKHYKRFRGSHLAKHCW